ncbi:MAG: Hsp70 family protein [Alphaproteobacteria bacterium]|nr:Hsp70 family protein [Alphaproteobacteria bacterium]
MRGACGLDFGTSNSTIGVWQQGTPTLVPLEAGKPTLPSAIFFNFEDDSVAFGRAAVAAYTAGTQGRLLRALKSVLGSSLMTETTQLKRRRLAFTEIIGLLLHQLKARAEAATGQELTQVVLGRPVQFVDDDPVADRAAQNQLEAAARAQGFTEIAFQYEPIAAALAYERQVSAEQLALIVDIGGGTADFSVVRVSPERAKATDRQADILANQGVHLGGTDFDRLFSLAEVMPLLGKGSHYRTTGYELPTRYYYDLATWQRIHSLNTKETLHELRQLRHEAAEPALLERLLAVIEGRLGHALAGQVEAAKIALTTAAASTLNLPLPGQPLVQTLTRTQLEAAIAPAVARIAATALATVQQARVPPTALQAIFLTGGSSQIPAVKASVLAQFPAAQVIEGDLFGSVGLGLTLDAQRKFAT